MADRLWLMTDSRVAYNNTKKNHKKKIYSFNNKTKFIGG
jgi:hypothetical protein